MPVFATFGITFILAFSNFSINGNTTTFAPNAGWVGDAIELPNGEMTIVGSDLSWWNKSTYYKEEKAIEVAFSELIKIPYNFIKYGLLYTEENL